MNLQTNMSCRPHLGFTFAATVLYSCIHASDTSSLHLSSGFSFKNRENFNQTNFTFVSTLGKECTNNSTRDLEDEIFRSSLRIEKFVDVAENANDDIAHVGFLNELRDEKLSKCLSLLQATRTDLENAILERDDSFQRINSLEFQLERVEQERSEILNETIIEIESLTKDNEQRKRQVRSIEDQLHETRKKLTEREYELHIMHEQAVSQYINFTLIRTDILSHIEHTTFKATHCIREKWQRQARQLSPKIRNIKSKIKIRYNEKKRYLQIKAAIAFKNLEHYWLQSLVVRPLIKLIWGKIVTYSSALYRPYEHFVIEVKEACYLSTLSAIEEISKSVLGYLDYHIQKKEEKAERMRERDEIANKRREKMKRIQQRERMKNPSHRHKERASHLTKFNHRDIHTLNKAEHLQPTIIHKKIRETFQFTLNNSKRIVQEGTKMFPLILTLLFSNSYVIGIILLYCDFPTELVWMYALVRLLLRFRRNRK